MASLQLYQGLRRRAVAAGLDVIMIEHRGVGMSRRDDFGADLPPQALTLDQIVDDVAAVLDDVQVDSAVIYGTSYGTYIAAVRDAIRGRLLQGDKPETAALAPKVRQLVDAGLMTASAGQIAATITVTAGPRYSIAYSTWCSVVELCCGRDCPGSSR